MQISGVGYVGFNASDPSAWREFGEKVLGMQSRDDTSADTVQLKMDDYRWRIAVHQSDADGFAYLGIEMPDAHAFDVAMAELQDAGIEVRRADDDLLKARSVGGLAYLRDPVGNRLELYYRPALDYSFSSPLGSEFVTEGQGFGHVVFLVEGDNYEKCQEFYVKVLGFKVSEYTVFGPVEVTFLHCNRRHHSLGIARAPVTACQHIMVQVKELDMVGKAMDRVQESNVPITLSIGRHRNDNMLSFYMRSPNGVDVEYGWGAKEVDDDKWVVTEWEGGDVWGHHFDQDQPFG
jgi:2,3-dihydroxybiphenyl 1,2-dioxygenase